MTGKLARLFARTPAALRRLCDEQSGQSLIVVALALTVALGISAFAIDVGLWYQKHHQQQVAYDAATLAAANCLSHPNTGPNTVNLPQCRSSTDSADAEQVAVYTARQNGITITPDQVHIEDNKVTIDAPSPAPVVFAVLFGIHNASVTSRAVSSWTPPTVTTTTGIVTETLTNTTTTPTSSPCTSSNQAQCSAIYTKNPSCSSGGITLGTASGGGASLSITGVIHSEGEMTISNNFSVYPASLTVSGGCYNSSNMPWANTNHNPRTVTATEVPSEPWPIDYSQAPYFTACTTNCKTVNGIANVPPYCTQATTSASGFSFYQNNGVYVLPQNGNVYCSIGSGNPSDPKTWNGPFSFQTSVPQYGTGCNQNSNSKFTSATFIGGDITASNSEVCMNPASNGCLFYSNGNITLYNGQFYWSGTVFDPGGTIQLGTASSGGEQLYSVPNGLIEGQNFTIQNGQINQLTGSGPVMYGGSGGGTTSTSTTVTTTTTTGTTTIPGNDSLSQ